MSQKETGQGEVIDRKKSSGTFLLSAVKAPVR